MFEAVSGGAITAIAIGVLLALIVLFALQVVFGFRVHRLTTPMYEYILSQSHAEAERIVNEAKEQARRLIAGAQESANTLVGQYREEIDARTKVYVQTLEALADDAHHNVSVSTEAAQKTHTEAMARFLKDLQARGEELKTHTTELSHELDGVFGDMRKGAEGVRRMLEEKANAEVEEFGRVLGDASSRSVLQIEEHTNELLKKAEADVAAYRESRKTLRDERMTDLVIETTKLVLQKNLSLDDHAELVEKALVEARATNLL